jgi:hypothetical protein
MLCNYDCPEDGDVHLSPVVAVYEVTEIFLRDERPALSEPSQPSGQTVVPTE